MHRELLRVVTIYLNWPPYATGISHEQPIFVDETSRLDESIKSTRKLLAES